MEPVLNNIKIGTLNVRSLNCGELHANTSFKKCDYIINLKYDVLFLTEIKGHSSQRMADLTKYLSMNNIEQYDIIVNSSSYSRGTAILIKKSHNAKFLKILKSPDENILACSVGIFGSYFTFVCVYAPCNADNAFFDSLNYYVNECGNESCIMGGILMLQHPPFPLPSTLTLNFILLHVTKPVLTSSHSGCLKMITWIHSDIFGGIRKHSHTKENFLDTFPDAV